MINEKNACYIFGAGEYFGDPPSVERADFVIAADGGYAYLIAANIHADLIVGDFDSLTTPPPHDTQTLVLPREKDDTDMIAAIREGRQRGFSSFHIYGGTGGRLDHTLANIQYISNLSKSGVRGYLYGDGIVITAITSGSLSFDKTARGTISMFAHTETVSGVYLSGLKYPLTDATVSHTYPVGVSNEFIGTSAKVSVREGTLILVFPAEAQIASD